MYLHRCARLWVVLQCVCFFGLGIVPHAHQTELPTRAIPDDVNGDGPLVAPL